MVWDIPLVISGQLSWLCPLPTSYPHTAYWTSQGAIERIQGNWAIPCSFFSTTCVCKIQYKFLKQLRTVK